MRNRIKNAIASRCNTDREADEKSKRNDWVSAPIKKIANAEDNATGNGFDVFEIETRSGRRVLLSLSCDIAQDPDKLRDEALRKNARLPACGRDRMRELLRPIISAEPDEHWRYAAHVGWHEGRDGPLYILGDRVIGEQSGAEIIKPPLWLNSRQALRYAKTGTLNGWKQGVAKPSAYSSRLVLMLSVTAASVLMRFTNRQPFMVCLFGDPKSGKSTALLAAMSVFGIGVESALSNWNLSASALMELARLAHDGVLPLNELASSKVKKSELYHKIRDAVYAYADGRVNAVNSRSVYAQNNDSATFRGIAVPTMEHSIEKLAGLANAVRDDGELARAHCVPSTRVSRSTIFDRPPTREERGGKSREEWAQRALAKLRRACAKHHGHAIDVLIAQIAEFGFAKTERLVRGWMREFLDAFPRQSEEPLQHALGNFAALYAGGRLLIECELVPWTEELLREMLLINFEDFLAEVRAEAAMDDEVIARIDAMLEPSHFPRKRNDTPLEDEPEFGFRRRSTEGYVYWVRTRALAKLIGSKRRTRRIYLKLHEAGRLVLWDEANEPSLTNKEWAEGTAKWSRAGKFRAVRIRAAREA